ncbi:hypothetical protein V500_00453 [Pseudogymnoascus sp. VKM F-4518 (FW-2643)]|nr:hypothetical protein V500_00453 [Pseudogymnoascus sp. VKM F-4518 (FW-2643)]
MVQRFELTLRHPKKFVQKSRRPRNLRISKRHYCFSRKRRLSLRWFKRKHIRPSRHVRIRSHGDASTAKIHKSQLPDLTPPNKATSSSPQPESVSTQTLDGISTEGLPSSWIPPEGTTFHPSLDATSLTSEQPQVHQDDTANTLHGNEDEGFSDRESDYSNCGMESEGEHENGRLYCSGRNYHFPIDEMQRETELQMHLIWKKYAHVWQERLNIQKMQNVLDIGPGAYYWADDLAFEYPQIIVTGVDIFSSKEKHASNVQRIKDDVEESWLALDKYDLVHSRDMALAIRDWDKLLKRAFRSLKPGGSIVVQEIYYSPQSEDGSVHSTAQPLADFFSKIAEGLKALRVDLHAITLLAEKMRAAGFINVTTNKSYITISYDTQDSAEETAMLMWAAIYYGLQGTALGPLTRGLGWERAEVEVYLTTSISDEHHRNMRIGGRGRSTLNGPLINAMSHSQANLEPPGSRKRKATITVTDEEKQRQQHSKMTAGDGPERIGLTAMAEPTDEIKPVDPTIIEPDEEDDKNLTVDPFKMVVMFAKMKLERERAAEKAIREGRRVMKEILISERCTSCGVRIFHMGRCDDCTKCTMCGQQRSWDGTCRGCAKLRCEEWCDNVNQSPIPDSALDVPAHQQDQDNPNDELEKHPSQPDAINSKPEQRKAEVDKWECAASSLLTMSATEELENEHAVTTWKCAASALLTMEPCQPILDDDYKSNIWKLTATFMLEIQPSHESEGTLPGIDFIINQNENRGRNGINVVPLQQMKRLLYGIPDAQIVAFFILSHLPEEHHALLSCTTIFAEERTPVWRNHVLFEGWSEEESDAFACEFSRLVPESSATAFVLQKWHGLLEVLNPIMMSISSLCFAQT